MQAVMKVSEFDINQIRFSDIKINEFGAKRCYVNYGPEKDRLILHTPRFTLPFNMGVFDKGDGPPKYSVTASFRDMENYAQLKEFHDKFIAIDQKMLLDGSKNAMPWFKKRKMTPEVLDALYTRLVRPSCNKETGEPDGKFPPTIRFKLPYWEGKYAFPVFDFNRNPIDLTVTPLNELLVKGAKIRALIQCGVVWFANGKYGVSWNIVQLRVRTPARLSAYSFLDDSDDEDIGSGNEQASGSTETPATPAPTQGTTVVDSDSSDDSDDSEAPPAPVKITKTKAKKPRGRKKK